MAIMANTYSGGDVFVNGDYLGRCDSLYLKESPFELPTFSVKGFHIGSGPKKSEKDNLSKKENLIFSGDATIYFDGKGNKTVVKKMKDEVDDPEKAAAYCILKSMGYSPKRLNELVAKGLESKRIKEEKRNKKKEKKNFVSINDDFYSSINHKVDEVVEKTSDAVKLTEGILAEIEAFWGDK